MKAAVTKWFGMSAIILCSHSSLDAMQALRKKQAQVDYELIRLENDKKIETIKLYNDQQTEQLRAAGIRTASLEQLNLKQQDFQTRATCGTCDLFIAYAIDKVLEDNTAVSTDTIHNKLSQLNYRSCINTCPVNIEAAVFRDTLIKDLKIPENVADLMLKRLFALGYQDSTGVYATLTHAFTGEDFYEALSIPGKLAELSLALRKGDIRAVHFVCNVGAPKHDPRNIKDYTAHWVLFSVVNYGGTITVYYVDSSLNNAMKNQSAAPHYLKYICDHMALQIKK